MAIKGIAIPSGESLLAKGGDEITPRLRGT
jgi:hypothetical protein